MKINSVTKVILSGLLLFLVLPIVKANAALPQRAWLDSPYGTFAAGKDITVTGWALDDSGIKEVDVFIDEKLSGKAVIGQPRPDVDKAFPGYKNGDESGFTYLIKAISISPGKHNIKVQAIGNDSGVQILSTAIQVKELIPMGNLDEPDKASYAGDINVRGWMLNSRGVKGVKIYLDDVYVENAIYGLPRKDVDNAFPGYPDGDKSGFQYTIKAGLLTAGIHTIKTVGEGVDGSKYTLAKVVEAKKLPGIMCIDEPYGKFGRNSSIVVRGWALNSAGIKQVKVYLDSNYIGDAETGTSREDVNAVFPGYVNGNKSGYSFELKQGIKAAGIHKITVEAIGNDGSKQTTATNIEIITLPQQFNIDEPSSQNIKSSSFKVRGWAINEAGVKEVNIYLDNKLLGKADYGSLRKDVANAFPAYKDGQNSGYEYVVDTGTVSAGVHSLKVSVVGNDSKVSEGVMNINIIKQAPMMFIDDPSKYTYSDADSIAVRGWALNSAGIKQVKIYLDNNYIGDAQTGISREDVNAAFPGYINGNKSGYYFELKGGTAAAGIHKITVEAIGNDNSKQTNTANIEIITLPQQFNIDEPSSQNIKSSSFKVRGWAINEAGVKEVNIYLDNKLLGKADYGSLRKDVAAAFPVYRDGQNSGYEYVVDTRTISAGVHILKVSVVGKDSKVSEGVVNINIIKQPPMMFIDDPCKYTYMDADSITIRGWALNASGTKEVRIYLDDNIIGNAQIGQSRPDVDKVYPGYGDGINSGYVYEMSTEGISYSAHTIKVEAVGNDGSSISQKAAFELKTETGPIGEIKTPSADVHLSSTASSLEVSGWSAQFEGVKDVKVYLDGEYQGDAETGLPTPEIKETYPKYVGTESSGYKYVLDLSKTPAGTHTIKVVTTGKDSRTYENSINFRKGRIIVLDAGHNYGGDDGAYSVINGVRYVERDLNMQVVSKLKQKLEALGFTVVMTRKEGEVAYDDLKESLKERVDIANNASADLFLSIHHDASESSSASGISTHWSSWRPNIDTSGTVTVNDITYDTTPCQAALISRDFANVLASKAAALGYVNRGSLDHNLFVTRNTNMPSVLLELGFITNKGDAIKAADSNEQWKAAELIANTINDYFNK
ncbi:MAG: Ig-like domain-containing protein [Bacillota bacterium]|nr:Ig-like domain-containing protein [Bacillota bacterium]